MHKLIKFFTACFIMLLSVNLNAQPFTETFNTDKGELKITLLGWSSLFIEFNGKNIYVDPVNKFKNINYANLPKADILFITHSHADHFNMEIIKQLINDSTKVVVNKECYDILGSSLKPVKQTTVYNNNTYNIGSLKFKTVPAYNISGDKIYHKKGDNNGFVFDFGGLNVLVAGDTENIPELKELKNIDVAFLPLNRPYTMDEIMFVDLVKTMQPKILYPYHYDKTLLDKALELLKDQNFTEIRVR